MEKNTAGDSLTESARGWWWGKEKIEENLFLFFSRARSRALAQQQQDESYTPTWE